MVGAGTAIADYLGSPTVMAYLEGLQTLLGALATTVRDVLVLAFQGAAIAWDLLSQAFTIAWPYIQTVLDTFFSLVTTVMAAVTGILTVLSKLVKGDFMGAWTTLKTTVGTALEDLWGFFKTLDKNLMTFFTTIKPEVLKLGTNMIQGVADGISSGAAWVKDALMAAARAAWSAVTAFFGGGGDGEDGETPTGRTSGQGLLTNTNGQNVTMNLTANYSNMQSESSLIADARAWMMTMGSV
jgi:phage-related protein